MANRSAAALGEIIRQQRELAELSMRQFAEMAGISNPYLSQIERGLRAPSETVLDGIANALKVSADALYKQAGVTPPGAQPAPSAVRDAIAADPLLTARQRTALREVYEAFVATSPRAPRPHRSAADPGAAFTADTGAAFTANTGDTGGPGDPGVPDGPGDPGDQPTSDE